MQTSNKPSPELRRQLRSLLFKARELHARLVQALGSATAPEPYRTYLSRALSNSRALVNAIEAQLHGQACPVELTYVREAVKASLELEADRKLLELARLWAAASGAEVARG